MGLGGLVTGIMGATGNAPKTDLPNNDVIGRDFQNLMQNYLGSQGEVYNSEAQYQPLYTKLALANQTATRSGNILDANALGPGIMAAVRNYNPSVTGTLDTLGSQAQEQLKLNGALDPATLRQVQQSTRSSQAARGLGYGPGDAAAEQFYQTQTMEQRRANNQQFAGDVATRSANYYGDPFQRMLAMPGVKDTPSITPSSQTDSMLGTSYNARIASNMGNANAQTAMLQGFNSFD